MADETAASTTSESPAAQSAAPAGESGQTQAQPSASTQEVAQTAPSTTEGQSAQPAPQAESGAPDLTRAASILREAGYSDEDIQELGPAAARVANRYESDWTAMADAVKASKDKAAQPAEAPQAHKDALSSSSEPVAPAAADSASNKFIDTLRSQYDDTLADSVKGYGEYIKEQVVKELTQQFGPTQQMVQQYAQSRAAEQCNDFFKGFVKQNPAYAEKFGSDPTKANTNQLKEMGAVVDLAIGLKSEAARRGQNLSGQQALTRAALAMTRDIRNAEAVKQVQDSVVKNARQISIPPGTAGSGQQGTGGDWRAAARAQVAGWQAARGG